MQFWHANLNLIIGGLFVTILVLIAAYLFMEFVKDKDAPGASQAGASAAGDFDRIEESLKKLLENANTMSARVDASDGVVSSGEDIQKLKELLSEKDKIIEEIKTQKEEGGAAAGDPDRTAELEGKIKDLEARLSEYEIIEDDIADLSMYKEENFRLKSELKALKKQQPTNDAAPADSPVTAPTTEPEAVSAPEVSVQQSDDSSSEDALDSVMAPSVGEAAPVEVGEATPEAASLSEPVNQEAKADDQSLTDDIMAEFAAAVQEQKGGKPVETAEVKEAPPVVESAAEEPLDDVSAEEEVMATADDEAVSSAESVGDQEIEDEVSLEALIKDAVTENQSSGEVTSDKEMASEAAATEEMPVEQEEEKVATAMAGGDESSLLAIDTDKMLGEIENLNLSAEGDDGEEALEQSIDTDKMLNETEDLNQSVGDDPARQV